ncbi:MAG: hypothetical protein ACHQHO_01040 [Solirubrobacterales bacterium]
MNRAPSLLHHTKLLPALILLSAALVALLCRPAPSSARAGASACSSASAHAKQPVRACAGRTRAGRSHGKAKGRRSGHRHPIHKKKQTTHHGSVHAPPAAARPATCEDGSQPVSEDEGSFSCTNGSEPVCASGVQPTPAKHGVKLVCPAPPAAGSDWSEAECEDGSAPERAGDGSFACEDESQPACPDGSHPTLSDDGAMLVCLAHNAPSSPPSPVEEPGEEDGESEGSAVSSRVVTAS